MAYLNQVVENIFGSNFQSSGKCGDLEAVLSSVTHELSLIESQCVSSGNVLLNAEKRETVDLGDGRIGSQKVCFDVHGHVGMFVVGSDRLSLTSQSNFSTIRSNCGVYKGKWQYEVLLHSSGIMQIGWATIRAEFSQEIGVGDTPDSYAFDGNRVRKWNVSTYKYGEPWQKDDVIGCCIDLDEGCVEFFRNGKSLGVAFNKVQLGPGAVYFPTVSLALLECLVANFGSTPFCYPIAGYQPIQDPPHTALALSSQLFEWTGNLLSLMDSRSTMPECKNDSATSSSALLLALGQITVSKLVPLLTNSYIVEAKLVPFVRGLCEIDSSQQPTGQVRPSARIVAQKNVVCANKRRKLMLFIDLLLSFSEEHELKIWTEYLISSLMVKFQCNTMVLEYTVQRDSLLVMNNLVKHKQLRHYLMKHIFFDKVRFPWFMCTRLSETVLESLVTKPWWETEKLDSSIELNKRPYLAAVNKIKSAVHALTEMQMELIMTLLDNTDGSENGPSSRKIFLRKFRSFLCEYLVSSRISALPSVETLLTLTWSFFHQLISALEILWAREIGSLESVIVPPSTFYDGSIDYQNIERLGGVLSYLQKILRSDLEQKLGPSHPVLQPPDSAPAPGSGPQASVDTSTSTGGAPSLGFMAGTSGAGHVLPLLARLLNQPGQAADLSDCLGFHSELVADNPDDNNYECGAVDSRASLIELLDGLVLLYHVAIHRHIKKVSAVRELMGKYIKGLSDVQERINTLNLSPVKQPKEVLAELQASYNVLFQRISKWSSQMAWVRAVIFSSENQANLVWLLRVVLGTMQASSEEGALFKFLPDFYLDCLVEMFTSLSDLLPPLAALEDIPDDGDLLHGVVQFIFDHINDLRIRTAKAKDTLIKALTNVMSSPNLVQIVHDIPASSRLNMIRFLLQPYENRAWAHSNWVMVRIWQGSSNAFAFRSPKSPYHRSKLRPKLVQSWEFSLSCDSDPCPSSVLQAELCGLLINEPDVATPFLNSVLNQLNWAFSEFIGMLQEIQNVSHRRERVLIESRQLKMCATCFDLTLSLLRVLEMVARLAPPVFTDSSRANSGLLLSRLFQLLCQVLNRASSQAGCFHHVTTLEIPDLENVDHFPILSAVCGILLAILADDVKSFSASPDSPASRVTKELLMEPSFQMKSLTCLTGDNPRFFSLNNYKDDVTSEEISEVQQMLSMLTHYNHLIVDASTPGDDDNEDDEMCTICYAFTISTTFEPCKHHSCRSCIVHHLMNNKECFFCKAVIAKVVDQENQVIYEIPVESNQPEDL